MTNFAIDRFERAFAEWLGVPHAFAFWRGRVALYAILRALGIGPGEEVAVTGYTCIAVARPIKYLGATPIYIDIDPVSYCMDPARLAEAITPRMRLIVAQHTYGYAADMDAIGAVAQRHGLPVIEDACLALGSAYKGRKVGTIGQAAFWSGQWSKHFTTGVGGWATTSDDRLAERIRGMALAEACQPSPRERALLACQRGAHFLLARPRLMGKVQSVYQWMARHRLVAGDYSYRADVPVMPEDFFKRMGPGQARAGLRRLRRLEANLRHRREMTALYDRLLAEAGWVLSKLPDYGEAVLVRYPVRVADKARAVAEARKRGIELGTWFDCPLHQIETDLEVYDYHEGSCPVAERAAREVVNLPLHGRADERLAHQYVEFLREIGPAG